jgi:hypothetical protein
LLPFRRAALNNQMPTADQAALTSCGTMLRCDA